MTNDPTSRVHRPETLQRSRVDQLKDVIAVASGRTSDPDRRSALIVAGVAAAFALLYAIDSALADVGATPLLLVSVVLGLVVLALCTAVLVTAYRWLDPGAGPTSEPEWPNPSRRHVFVLLWSLAALAYGLETMSATAAVIIGSGDGLSNARTFFLWHLADTLPVFTVTDTLGFARPGPPLDAAGAMALVMKIVLILPLMRIAVATFRLTDETGAGRAEETGPQQQSGTNPMRSAVRAVLIVVVPGAVLALLLTICNWVTPFTRWVASLLPGTTGRWIRSAGNGLVHVLGLWVVQAIILVVLSIVLLLATSSIVLQLLRVDVEGATFRVSVGLTVLFASFMSLVLVFSTAVAVDLMITCFARGDPPMIGAAGHLEWYAWHSSNVLPELTAPDVLQWRQPTDQTDIGRGVMLLFVKLVGLLVIAVPVARVVRAARDTWSSKIA